MSDSASLEMLLEKLASGCLESDYCIATAESCTGGGIGQALTSLPGSSNWYLGGVVSYSNDLKKQFLGVTQNSLDAYGAVSEQVAAEMALGIAGATGASHAVSTSGIAGPDGGTDEKPVGTVCFGFVSRGQSHTETKHFKGGRDEVRRAATFYAIKKISERL